MNGYLIGVVGTVLLCALLSAILPEGKTANLIRAVTKLACLVAIITPIPSFLQQTGFGENDKNLQNFFGENSIQTDAGFIQYYSEWRIADTEKQLQSTLLKDFDFVATVKLDWEYDNEVVNGLYENTKIKIRRIILRSEDDDAEKRAKVLSYVKQNYCSEVLLE